MPYDERMTGSGVTDPGGGDPIRRTAVVSTGRVYIRPDHVLGGWRPTVLWLFTSRRWTGALPINVYMIEHERGLVLFDSGQDRAAVTDPAYFPGGFAGTIYRRLARFEIGERETLPELLRQAGFDPAAVTHVVLSHLHQDHIGGIGDFPGAEVLVSRAEWEAHRARGAEVNGYLAAHIDLPGVKWRYPDLVPSGDPLLVAFAGAHDLFGDGSLTILSTPGHTPGAVSLLIRRPGHVPVLLVGDLTYDAGHFDEDHVPGVGVRRTLRATTRLVQELKRRLPGLVLAAAHDPAARAAFEQAMTGTGA
jgi:N-acyl homoserine lactone hydrolase